MNAKTDAAPGKNDGALTLRCLAALEQLSGHVVAGMANKDLAVALGCSPTNVTRATDLLRDKGWVEKDEGSGRFRVTPRFARLSFSVTADLERSQAALTEQKRNYTLGSEAP